MTTKRNTCPARSLLLLHHERRVAPKEVGPLLVLARRIGHAVKGGDELLDTIVHRDAGRIDGVVIRHCSAHENTDSESSRFVVVEPRSFGKEKDNCGSNMI